MKHDPCRGQKFARRWKRVPADREIAVPMVVRRGSIICCEGSGPWPQTFTIWTTFEKPAKSKGYPRTGLILAPARRRVRRHQAAPEGNHGCGHAAPSADGR
jgi:hypothetical protein